MWRYFLCRSGFLALCEWGKRLFACASVYVVSVLQCIRASVRQCVRVCLCVRACTRVCMRPCVRACVHGCLLACVRECVRTCIRAHSCERRSACVQACVFLCVRASVRASVRVSLCASVCAPSVHACVMGACLYPRVLPSAEKKTVKMQAVVRSASRGSWSRTLGLKYKNYAN